MNLRQQIDKDFIEALKTKNEEMTSVLRMLKSAIKNKEIELRVAEGNLSDEKILEIIQKEIKQRRDAMADYTRGQRGDLAQKEKREMALLQKYLPEQLSEAEITSLAQAIIQKLGADKLQDMGMVMGKLVPQLQGRADGAIAAQIVKRLLNK